MTEYRARSKGLLKILGLVVFLNAITLVLPEYKFLWLLLAAFPAYKFVDDYLWTQIKGSNEDDICETELEYLNVQFLQMENRKKAGKPLAEDEERAMAQRHNAMMWREAQSWGTIQDGNHSRPAAPGELNAYQRLFRRS